MFFLTNLRSWRDFYAIAGHRGHNQLSHPHLSNKKIISPIKKKLSSPHHAGEDNFDTLLLREHIGLSGTPDIMTCLSPILPGRPSKHHSSQQNWTSFVSILLSESKIPQIESTVLTLLTQILRLTLLTWLTLLTLSGTVYRQIDQHCWCYLKQYQALIEAISKSTITHSPLWIWGI